MNGFKHGDHVCSLYDTQEEQIAVAAAYVAEGLNRGERCLYVADSPTALYLFCESLDRFGVDSRGAVDKGALLLATKHEAHLIDGRFDCERMLRLLGDAVEKALDDGFVGLRTCGDMSWLLDNAPGSTQVVEYESLLSQFFQSVRAVGMCQYDVRRVQAALVDHALATHPTVVVEKRHKHNPFYVPGVAKMPVPLEHEELEWKFAQLREQS
jgi:two-component system, chemotaxis family, sensor kinase Cph1